MPITGYKIAKNGEKRVLVTLTIPDGTLSNMWRNGVKDRVYAKYRCQQAYVESIEDDTGRTYEHAFPSVYLGDNFVYRRGTIASVPLESFDSGDKVCSNGIHYFLSRERALNYDLHVGDVSEGLYREWDDHGGETFRCTITKRPDTGIWYQKAEKWGLIQRKSGGYVGKGSDGRILIDYWPDYCYFRYYPESGALMIDAEVHGGKFHGLYKDLYEDGAIRVTSHYVQGKRHGITQGFYRHGRIAYELLYRDGLFTGHQINYSADGRRLD